MWLGSQKCELEVTLNNFTERKIMLATNIFLNTNALLTEKRSFFKCESKWINTQEDQVSNKYLFKRQIFRLWQMKFEAC